MPLLQTEMCDVFLQKQLAIPAAFSRSPTSNASLSVWDLDDVKHVKYCKTVKLLKTKNQQYPLTHMPS